MHRIPDILDVEESKAISFTPKGVKMTPESRQIATVSQSLKVMLKQQLSTIEGEVVKLTTRREQLLRMMREIRLRLCSLD